MPVPDQTPVNSSTGNGVTTVFAYTFKILDEEDMAVEVDGVEQVLNSDYTVSGVGVDGGGNVTFISGAPANGTLVVRRRDVMYARTDHDYQEGGGFEADTVDEDLDLIVMMIQQLALGRNQALKAPASVTTDQVIAEAIWALRAAKIIGFDASGNLTLLSATDVDLATVTAFIETLFDDGDAATARGTLGAAASGANTDITSLSSPALGAATATTAATGDNSTKVATTAFVAASIALRGYLAGCGLANNASDATNDIDIAAGVCRDSTNTVTIAVAALTKRLDASWAAGTNQGMRYSGAAIADTTYGIWAVAKSDGTQDIYAYPNSGAPTAATVLAALQAETGGSTYLYVRRIGLIVRASSAIKAFKQLGDKFSWDIGVNDVAAATNPGTSAISRTLTVPIGTVVEAWFSNYETNQSTNRFVLWTALDQTDSTPSATINSLNVNNSSGNSASNGEFYRKTNTSGQIRYRSSASGANDTTNVVTNGWIDRRGRDD